MSKRSIKCRMLPTPIMADSLSATIAVFSAACNSVLKVAIERDISSQFCLHRLAYRPTRDRFGMTANLTIRAIARVAQAMVASRTTKHIPKSFRTGSVDYDARVFAYRMRDESVSLSTICGRIRVPLLLGEYQRAALDRKNPTFARILRQGRKWYINIVVEDTDGPKREGPPLGVDLGIRNIATLSTGKAFPGNKMQVIKQRFEKVRASLQSKGTRGAKRVLKRLAGRQRRMIRWFNHGISKQVVREAVDGGFGSIRMENLRNIRQRTRTFNKRLNRMVAGWSFAELQAFLSRKAIRKGIAIEFVNPSYTSQTCHHCGSKGTRKTDIFSCAPVVRSMRTSMPP